LLNDSTVTQQRHKPIEYTLGVRNETRIFLCKAMHIAVAIQR